MSDLINQLSDEAVELLIRLIKTPSFSREEADTATLIEEFLMAHGVAAKRQQNNVWAVSAHFDESKPTILLNSHHDTVKAGADWQYDPFGAVLEGDKLTGLGSNDAGASAVSLLATFLCFQDKANAFNLICAITAERKFRALMESEAYCRDLVK